VTVFGVVCCLHSLVNEISIVHHGPKSATLFSIITPTFLGRFLFFCTSGNRNEYDTLQRT